MATEISRAVLQSTPVIGERAFRKTAPHWLTQLAA